MISVLHAVRLSGVRLDCVFSFLGVAASFIISLMYCVESGIGCPSSGYNHKLLISGKQIAGGGVEIFLLGGMEELEGEDLSGGIFEDLYLEDSS